MIERARLAAAVLNVDAARPEPKDVEPPNRQEEQPKQESAKIVELDLFRKR